MTFDGVPLIWKSQLILEICLSTLHAEYVGSTNTFRALLPIQNLIIDTLTQLLDMYLTKKPKIICCVFVDNQEAYLLVTNQQLLVRTKYYFCVKYHFFWQFVYQPERNPDGWLMVEKYNTELFKRLS